jgi:hypothetical protein
MSNCVVGSGGLRLPCSIIADDDPACLNQWRLDTAGHAGAEVTFGLPVLVVCILPPSIWAAAKRMRLSRASCCS